MQFYKDGAALPATVIALEAGNIVTQVKTEEKDGYAAVQVGCCTFAVLNWQRRPALLRLSGSSSTTTSSSSSSSSSSRL